MRGSAKVACKTEPGIENQAGEQHVNSGSTCGASRLSVTSKASSLGSSLENSLLKALLKDQHDVGVHVEISCLFLL